MARTTGNSLPAVVAHLACCRGALRAIGVAAGAVAASGAIPIAVVIVVVAGSWALWSKPSSAGDRRLGRGAG